MPMSVSKDGWITGDGAITKNHMPTIEHGFMPTINGIIVHQTDTSSAQATFNSYRRAGANGAHFLIDKDGTTYQVASLHRKTWHVGNIKAKCLATYSCSPVDLKALKAKKPAEVNRIEMMKSVPLRFPSNSDSIGIELVGRAALDPKLIRPGMTAKEIDRLRDEKGVYEAVTTAQNVALLSLISKIQSGLQIPPDQVYSHPQVSWKNETEASTAQWPGRK